MMNLLRIINIIKIFNFRLEDIFKYPKSDFDRLVAIFIPLLDCFSTTVIEFGSYDERLQARNNVHIQFPKKLEKVTLILDSTFLLLKEEGMNLWMEVKACRTAHINFMACLFLISKS
jgi:hypothetical protein